jgi:uncharacterized membrane protein
MTQQTTAEASTHSMTAPELRPVGATFCLFLSLVGVAINVYLTVMKFKMTYTPCLTDAGSCRVGEMTCNDALSSSWSVLLNLPLSLWGAAFYVVTAALAASLLLRRNFLGGAAPDLLLVCALWSVLMTLVLGAYTLFALASACPFCLSLYAVSVLLLAGAQLVHGPLGLRRPRAWLEEVRVGLPQVGDTAFRVAMVFVCAAGALSMTYHGLRNFADSQVGCPEPTVDPPAPSIRAGADEPKAIVAMFIDMTCHFCRKEFKKLGNALLSGAFPEPVQLWIFHTPRQACDPSAFPAGKAKSDDNARYDNACLAARAAECVERLRPGSGFEYIGGLFALHEAREKDVPLFTAERVANKAVDFELEIDPDDQDNELYRCINSDAEVLARITEHQKYAEDFEVPTIAIYPARDGGLDLADKPLYADANTSLATIFAYVSAQAKKAR